jgi:hypothetical protein
VIVGLDSAYFSPEGSLYVNGLLFPERFPNHQQAFLQDKTVQAQLDGKKLIVLDMFWLAHLPAKLTVNLSEAKAGPGNQANRQERSYGASKTAGKQQKASATHAATELQQAPAAATAGIYSGITSEAGRSSDKLHLWWYPLPARSRGAGDQRLQPISG